MNHPIPKVVNTIYKFKRGTKDRWLEVDPILGAGEPGHEIDTGMLKIGNGFSRWSDLPYASGDDPDDVPVSMADLDAHVNDETPHPVYDDGPSFLLLYENAKV